ncbi:MAG: TonB-dependent siderophore receptor [Bacteroidetes bacterium]|nr:TonB-dependent siderophore receptor [Bacteroidota bacterium]
MKILTTLVFSLYFCALWAQDSRNTGILTGRILDNNSQPLAYVTVLLKDTPYGTQTDEQGVFLLKAPSGAYLLLSRYVGYEDQSKQVTLEEGKESRIELLLDPIDNQLQAVQISGIRAKTASATRTLLEVKDIPQAIVVIGQKTVQQQAAFDLTTLTRNISGLNFTGNYSGAGSYQFFNARGFDLSNSQNYRWNGMMIWNLGNNYSDNIEQVEFLKGPTSILFGDAAPGGVLNFSTKKPLAQFYTGVDLKLGSWGLVRPALDVSGPINKSKTLRYRLNTSFQSENSFRNQVSSRRFLLAPTLAWDITPRMRWNLEAVLRRSTATDDPGLVSPDGTVKGLDQLSPHLYLSEPSRKYKFGDQSYFSTLTYRLGDTWRIRNVLFYGYTQNRPWGIWPDAPDSLGNIQRNQYGYKQGLHNLSGSLDALGSFYTGKIKHHVLLGMEYQRSHFRYTNEGYLDSLDMNNIYQMVYNQVPNTPPADGPYLPFISIIARAGVYAQDQLMFFHEKLHLMLGLRAGLTTQGNHYIQAELPGTNYEGYKDDLITKKVLSPRIGLVFRPVSWASYYTSYSQGYEVNAPDLFAQNYSTFANPPATRSAQVEAGIKASLVKNQLGVSITGYQIDKRDPYGFVYLDPQNPNYDEYNVYYDGHHQSRGIEIDLDGKISPWLSLTAGAAYTSTKVISDPGYPRGNRLPNAPRYTGNVWLNFEPQKHAKGFSLGAGYFYKDKFFSSLNNDPNLEVRRSQSIDVAAGYQFKGIGIQLNVTNLTNRVNYLNPWIFNLFDVQPLRRIVFTLTYKMHRV